MKINIHVLVMLRIDHLFRELFTIVFGLGNTQNMWEAAELWIHDSKPMAQ